MRSRTSSSSCTSKNRAPMSSLKTSISKSMQQSGLTAGITKSTLAPMSSTSPLTLQAILVSSKRAPSSSLGLNSPPPPIPAERCRPLLAPPRLETNKTSMSPTSKANPAGTTMTCKVTLLMNSRAMRGLQTTMPTHSDGPTTNMTTSPGRKTRKMAPPPLTPHARSAWTSPRSAVTIACSLITRSPQV